MAFLEQVASQLSLMLDNARLFAMERAERHRLETMNRQREDFISIISHELKTPLTSIKSSSELLSEELASDRKKSRKRLIENIRRSADRLERMLNDMLDMVRVRSAPLEVSLRPTDIAPCIRNAVELCLPPMEEKRQKLQLDMPDSLPPIMADPNSFEHVLTNLLDNALKHTPSGGRVTVEAEEVREAQALRAIEPALDSAVSLPAVVVTVSDTGCGIPPEELSRNYGRYDQVDKSRASGKSGVGLGLAIAQEIVAAHGGRIAVQSVAGVGTKFIVALPVSGREGVERQSR